MGQGEGWGSPPLCDSEWWQIPAWLGPYSWQLSVQLLLESCAGSAQRCMEMLCGNGMGLRAGAAAAVLLARAPSVAQGVPVTVLCRNEAVVVLWVPAARTCGEQPQRAWGRAEPSSDSAVQAEGERGWGLGCPCCGNLWSSTGRPASSSCSQAVTVNVAC